MGGGYKIERRLSFSLLEGGIQRPFFGDACRKQNVNSEHATITRTVSECFRMPVGRA